MAASIYKGGRRFSGSPNRFPGAAGETVATGITSNGAPVDGTSGTGVGFAGKGSICSDYTNGKLYVNGGTMASPLWKLVTSA